LTVADCEVYTGDVDFTMIFPCLCFRLQSLCAMALMASGAATAFADFTIRGTVRDTSHNILPDVKVAVAGGRATTDDRGNFSIVVRQRPPGTVNFDKPGYSEVHLPLPADNEPMQVSLKPNQNNAGLIVEKTRLSISHSLTTVKDRAPALLKRPLTAAVYREFVAREGEGSKDEVIVRLYVPATVNRLSSVFLISEHGMGGGMMEHPLFREFADRHAMALVGVIGDPIQRGIFPAETLDALLTDVGTKAKHPELGQVPAFTFGHSNGTGFSDLYASLRPERTLGWVSYHCGGSWQLQFPDLERSPGLVMHGQKDQLFTDEDSVVRSLRHDRNAAVSLLVEGEASHWPVDRVRVYELVLAFCEACIRVRAPQGFTGGGMLVPVRISEGWLAGGYDRKAGGLQAPPVASYDAYTGDRSTANWLPDETFARQWLRFSETGSIGKR
jgi:hypothetical protein